MLLMHSIQQAAFVFHIEADVRANTQKHITRQDTRGAREGRTNSGEQKQSEICGGESDGVGYMG